MKKIITITAILYLFVAVAAFAQTSGTKWTPPNTDVPRPYPHGSLISPWSSDAHAYDYAKGSSQADIYVRGIVDTAQGPNAGTTDSAWVYYYGKIWSCNVGDTLVSMEIIGRDSSMIWVHYRYVSFTANTYGAGAWTPWIGANTTITTPRSGGGSQGDTLITVANPPLITKNTGIQFRYRIRSNRAAKVAGLKRQINEPSTTQFYSFAGEIILHWRRTHR